MHMYVLYMVLLNLKNQNFIMVEHLSEMTCRCSHSSRTWFVTEHKLGVYHEQCLSTVKLACSENMAVFTC